MNDIFLDNKYTRWYYAIVERCAVTDPTVYSEEHHILPRSLGGSDDGENLVRLSGHDHAWCHWLLTKMTSGEDKAKMIYAFRMMEVQGDHMKRQSSYAIVRAYEKNRLEWSKTHSETMKEQFENGREIWNKGRKEDRPEVLANVKAAALARPALTPEKLADSVAKRVESMKKNGTNVRSQETKDKQRAAMTGLVRGPMNDAEKLKRSIAQKGKDKPKGFAESCAERVKGNISINKDGAEKKVKQPDLKSYLDDGWSLGGRPRKKKQAA